MKENNCFRAEPFQRISRIMIYVSLIIISGSCQNPKTEKGPLGTSLTHSTSYDSTAKWLDWNVLFKSGSTAAERNKAINSLKQYITDYINKYNADNGARFAVNQFLFNCPCDSTLWNLNAIPVMGSGQAPNPPPKPGSGGLGGSGDAIDLVNQNNSFVVDSSMYLTDSVNTNIKVYLNGTNIDHSKTLAVMDTGLDSTLFDKEFAGLLWSAPNGQRTLRNFLFFSNGKALDYYFDDEKHKHGTAVTGIALQALQNLNPPVNVRPRVMVLKVLDNNKTGNTFSVSCALSYAIQQQATLINASLGYYSTGEIDSVLQHYVELSSIARPHPIPLVAAAGNLPESHDQSLCGDANTGNELTASRLFFPACFSTKYSNLIAVTGLNNPQSSCFYQNYSSTYVSIGVVTNPSSPNCCRFPVEFLKSGYEGSSFATPVVSGKIMGCLLGTVGTIPPNCLINISSTQSVKQVSIDGRYLIYNSPPTP